jgi:hypothetical protein
MVALMSATAIVLSPTELAGLLGPSSDPSIDLAAALGTTTFFDLRAFATGRAVLAGRLSSLSVEVRGHNLDELAKLETAMSDWVTSSAPVFRVGLLSPAVSTTQIYVAGGAGLIALVPGTGYAIARDVGPLPTYLASGLVGLDGPFGLSVERFHQGTYDCLLLVDDAIARRREPDGEFERLGECSREAFIQRCVTEWRL